MRKEITPISALNLLSAKDKKAVAEFMRSRARKHGVNLNEKGITRRLIRDGLAAYNNQINLAREDANKKREGIKKTIASKGNKLLPGLNPEEYAKEIYKAREAAKKNKKKDKLSSRDLVFTFVLNGIGDEIVLERIRREQRQAQQKTQNEVTHDEKKPEAKKVKKRKIIAVFEKAVKKLKT